MALVEMESGEGDAWKQSVLRAGQIFEWLLEQVPEDRAFITMMAAASYQISDFPALASGLLHTADFGPDFSVAIKAFLRGDFSDLLRASSSAMAILGDNSETSLGSEDEIGDAIAKEMLRCLGVVAAAMKWGDETRLPEAIAKLEAIAAVSCGSHTAHSGLLAKLVAMSARGFGEVSLRSRLDRLGRGRPENEMRALERFARQAYVSSKSLVWKSQDIGFERLFRREPFVLCTPTGSGKTMIAELAIMDDLLGGGTGTEDDTAVAPLALYLVPSRALAAEVERRLEADFNVCCPGGIVVTGLYGGTDWGPTDAWLTSDRSTVLVCTYEKAEALLRYLGAAFLRRVKIIIIDEAHTVQFDGDVSRLNAVDSRSLKLESLATRLFATLPPSGYRIIALSAVTAGFESQLSGWLAGNGSAPAFSDYRSTRQLVGRLLCGSSGGSEIYYDLLDRSSLRFAEDHELTPYVPRPFSQHPPVSGFDGHVKKLYPHLVWAAMNLSKSDLSGRPHTVLVSMTEHIDWIAKAFLDLVDDQWSGHVLPQFFDAPTDGDDLRLWQECLEASEDYFSTESREYKLLRRGIVVHHSKVPPLLGRKLKDVIERRIARIVIATSTLSEGVNLPFEYILLPSLDRGRQLMSPQEFLNLIGRAGRPGTGTEGRVLVLLPHTHSEFSDEKLWNGYFSLVRDISVNSSPLSQAIGRSPLAELIRELQRRWRAVSLSASVNDFFGWLERTVVIGDSGGPDTAISSLESLDSVLLAVLDELEQRTSNAGQAEPSRIEIESHLISVWNRSFAHATAVDEGVLSRIFIGRGKAIGDIYVSRDYRHRLYKTGFPPRCASALLGLIEPMRGHLMTGSGYASWSADERYRFIEESIEIMATVDAFTPESKPGWKKVLHWWLNKNGAPVGPKGVSAGKWLGYASKNFTYKANWVLGGLTAALMDELSDDGRATALSIARWPETGLPWISFWLKELLTWGTLDPVAAFLLARGSVTSRVKAEATARGYYDSVSAEVSDNDKLDPRRIRDWLESQSGWRAIPSDESPTEIMVDLVRDRADYVERSIRVLPQLQRAGGVRWSDAAGYVVATSVRNDDSFLDMQDKKDYVLHTEECKISVSRYL
ncbi:MAG: DEAD/DEAH box helicase [Patescibacteria group bacterium]